MSYSKVTIDVRDKIMQKKSSLVNIPSEYENDMVTKLIDLGVGSPSIYAFVEDANGHKYLWATDKEELLKPNWCEVTDLTDVPVWEYMKLREYAIACGVISKDADSWKI